MPEVANPCIRHCCLNEQNICLGCYRTLDDILSWHQATDDQKRQMLQQARQRQASAKSLVTKPQSD